jgi:preprotein translocase subunit SecD
MRADTDASRSRATSPPTAANAGRKVALLIDDRVYNVMNIGTPIDNGQAAIAGINSEIFATQLTIALSSGEMPIPVTVGLPTTYGTPPAAE